MNESLTPQEKISKYNADLSKKAISIQDLNKRLQSATKSGNKQRVEILKIDLSLAKIDIQRLRLKVQKEQLKSKA
jgi:5-bromo-4-chloroindolyl phosphate hydrolysis protein